MMYKKTEKCHICQNSLKKLRWQTITTFKQYQGIKTIDICEKCILRLPKDLIKDVMSDNNNDDYRFGNKIFSAIKNNQYRELNKGVVFLLQNRENEEYFFEKITNGNDKIIFDIIREKLYNNKISSIYWNGEKYANTIARQYA